MMSWPRKKSSVLGIKPRSKSKTKSSKSWNSQTDSDIKRQIKENNQYLADRAKE